MKRISFILPVLALMFFAPFATQASELPKLDLFTDEIYLKKEVTQSLIPSIPSVLGASTDDESVSVPKKLDSLYRSYFRDVSFKAPKGWYVADEYDDTSLYTYAVNEEMTAQITIERFDAVDVSVDELSTYVADMCEACGYQVTGEGSAKIGKLKARYVEATNGDVHLKYYITIRDEIGYVIELLTYEESWEAYKEILEKSVKSIKLRALPN
jgi:hypothetical protein